MRIPLDRPLARLIWLAVSLMLVACSTAEKGELLPTIEVYQAVSEDADEDVAPLGCEAICGERLPGANFRFTLLHVTEPNESTSPRAKALQDILNDMWSRDLSGHVLNIIFELGSVDYESGEANLEVGPGWYRLTPEAAQDPPPVGEVAASDVSNFCLLEGVEGESLAIALIAQLDAECGFEIDPATAQDSDGQGAFLLFHTGPTTDPVICAPDQGSAPGLADNTIPLAVTAARGRFDASCDRIVEGYLEGCIAVEHANQICMCTRPGGHCKEDASPSAANYCGQVCSSESLNLGGFMLDVAQIEPSCTVFGRDGIRIAAMFEAKRLPPERYDPERSVDCIH